MLSQNRSARSACIAGFVVTTFATSCYSQVIRYVDGTKPPGGNGQSWATAYNTVETGIAGTPADGQLWVKAGTYKPGTARTSTFQLKNKVKIYGGFAGTETELFERDPVANLTILSGEIGSPTTTQDNCHHVVSAIGALQFPGTILDGFTITGGNTFDRSENPRTTSAEEASARPQQNTTCAGVLAAPTKVTRQNPHRLKHSGTIPSPPRSGLFKPS